MYRPNRQFNRTNEAMYGGDYISTISTSTLTTPDISLSSLYYIMSVANITSIDTLTTLTAQQLEQLSLGIDEQIRIDQIRIGENLSTIAGIGTQITTPQTGLLDTFNRLDDQYQSSLVAYELTSTSIAETNARYNRDRSTLSSLYLISTFYTSSITSYESQYSTIVSSLKEYASTVYKHEQDYQESLLRLSANKILCGIESINLSTISSSLSINRANLLNPNQTPQALSSISSIYSDDLGIYNQISTQVINCAISTALIENDIKASYYAISSILQISSFLMLDMSSYSRTIEYYEELDEAAEADIARYSRDISTITSQICTLQGTNTIILNGVQSEIGAVNSQGTQFYSLYKQGLEAECDEYIYGIQEFNSQVGYITASLGIAINANSVEIDICTFRMVDPSLSSSERNTASERRSDLTGDNWAMNEIIGKINSLDGQFASIIQYVSNEKTDRRIFIDKRKQIFTTYEVPALGYSQSQLLSIQADYFREFVDLNDIITGINSDIQNRDRILRQIQDVIDPIKGQINSYFQKYLHITNDQLPNSLTRVLADDGVTPLGGSIINKEYTPPNTILATNANYSFIPPIVF